MSRLKKYWPALLVVAILLTGAAWVLWLKKETTLVDLQKQYLFAKTDTERDKVIDRLEEYYLNLPIADSISQRVDDEVQKLLNTTEIDLADYSEDFFEHENPYELENRLKVLLKTAMIARARKETLVFNELMGKANKLAKIVDEGTENDYWAPFVWEINSYNKENSLAWLKGQRSERLCYRFRNSNFLDAEKYGALGLKYLKEAKDERIQLDILLRLQYILSEHRGMHDLSVAMAELAIINADKIKYIFRANGIRFNQAEALSEGGQIEKALELFQKVKKVAETHKEIPSMSWYGKNALLQIAFLYWQLNQFEQALSVSENPERLNLTPIEKMTFHNTKGLIYNSLGNYEVAESEYKAALSIAESENAVFNIIRYLHNLGLMFYELTEYEKALQYYYRKKIILEKSNPENYQQRIHLIINIANIMTETNRFESVDSLLNKATGLLDNLGNLPVLKADLLSTLGTFNLEIGNNQNALNNFQKAEEICNENGLFRIGLNLKIRIAESLIGLRKFSEARKKTNESLSIAEKIGDDERIIDAIALLAEIESNEDNVKKAVQESNKLIDKIEKISAIFENKDRLTSYRQKIYDYLKKAVVYEIQSNRIDSAFVKLDYAKARSLKNLEKYGNGHYTNLNGKYGVNYVNHDTLKSQLDKQSLIIDYFITDDTLYVFMLNHEKLQLLKKAIQMDVLKETVYAYKDSINKTEQVFQDYNLKTITTHFEGTTQLGHKLFHDLMGWPILIESLEKNELLYIIPDEFLYELPFETLVVNTKKPLTYLVNKSAVKQIPGTSFLYSTVENVDQDFRHKKVLISADLDFTGVGDLISFVKSNFPFAEEIQVNREPTKQDVLDKLDDGYEIIIIIGHGLANAKYPEFSNLQFSITNSKTNTSKKIQLTIADLKQVSWSGAEMVILVGCETAGGKLYRGTGISGLQQNFISMGARSVMASLWKIDAAEAIPQTQDFLQFWLSGLKPEIALKETQLNSIKKLNENSYYNFPHPYFWGSFNLLSRN